jgi:diguanylate cyclase (GGDEF)-like protein
MQGSAGAPAISARVAQLKPPGFRDVSRGTPIACPSQARKPEFASGKVNLLQEDCRVNRPLPFLHTDSDAVQGDPATLYAKGATGGGAGLSEIRQPLLEHVITAVREAERRMEQQRKRIAQLEALSITDELTGLLNRRGFLAGLRQTLAIARRYGESGALILCDLDGFKKINDCRGHMAGDKALCHISSLFSRSIRETDLLGRLGGDEFAILLPRTPAEDGRMRVALLDKLITRSRFWWDGQRLPLKASFGLAPYKPGDEEESLMRQVDEAMYAHKRARRNANPESLGYKRPHPGHQRLMQKDAVKFAPAMPAEDHIVPFPPAASQ